MPEICRFLGIVIAIFHREHGSPHFHAKYGEYEITVEIETGQFPRRSLTAVMKRCDLHKDELMENMILRVIEAKFVRNYVI